MKLAKLSIIIVLGLFLLEMSGCTPPLSSGTGMAFRLSTYELASRLGLQVTQETDRYIEMKNSSNRVLVFIHDGGRVFVNTQPIGNTGLVARMNGSVYLPEILETLIRPHLLKSQGYIAPKPVPVPQWTPPASTPLKGLVIIDAGHGGKDPGTISYLGAYEKGVNLKIAAKTAAILKKRGVQVKLLRDSDTFIDKYDRADITNRTNSDLFVSIHCDSNANLAIHGYSVWVCRSASRSSRTAAAEMEKAMAKTGLSSRGVREGDYVVLVNTQCPAILVECGHLSNPKEAVLLFDPAFQDKIASAIADGIASSLGKI